MDGANEFLIITVLGLNEQVAVRCLLPLCAVPDFPFDSTTNDDQTPTFGSSIARQESTFLSLLHGQTSKVAVNCRLLKEQLSSDCKELKGKRFLFVLDVYKVDSETTEVYLNRGYLLPSNKTHAVTCS